MMRLAASALLALALGACEGAASPADSLVATPFAAEYKAVPVALDPHRPLPPPPTRFDIARDEERIPPQP